MTIDSMRPVHPGRIGNPSHPERPGWPEDGGYVGGVRGQRATAGLTGVRTVPARAFRGCWGEPLRGSVPPADERGCTVPGGRDGGYQATR
jgi:hypothetical protein